jgi:hypothetical protein
VIAQPRTFGEAVARVRETGRVLTWFASARAARRWEAQCPDLVFRFVKGSPESTMVTAYIARR